jgi:hypothetical protein
MAVRSGWFLPALAALAGCTALHNEAPSIPAIAAAPLPDSRYTQEPLPRVRGAAAWRPAAVEHVLNLDGQRCTVVDLAVRCAAPAPAGGPLAEHPADPFAPGVTAPAPSSCDAAAFSSSDSPRWLKPSPPWNAAVAHRGRSLPHAAALRRR